MHQVGEGTGLHLYHYLTAMNLDCLFAGAEFRGDRLLRYPLATNGKPGVRGWSAIGSAFAVPSFGRASSTVFDVSRCPAASRPAIAAR